MKKFLGMCCVCLGLISCSEGNDPSTVIPDTTNQNGTRLVRRVFHTDGSAGHYTMRYFYVGSRLYKITASDGNNSNDLTQIFSYTGDKITKIESFDYNNTKTRELTFQYDAAGRISHERMDDLADVEYSYTTNSSNILTRQAYGVINGETQYGNKERFAFAGGEIVNKWREVDNIDRDSVHETITYDGHNSPVRNMPGYDQIAYFRPWREIFYFGSEQNVASSSSVIYFNGSQSTQNLVYSYTYNNFGYPMSCRLQYIDAHTNETVDTPYSVEYYYE